LRASGYVWKMCKSGHFSLQLFQNLWQSREPVTGQWGPRARFAWSPAQMARHNASVEVRRLDLEAVNLDRFELVRSADDDLRRVRSVGSFDPFPVDDILLRYLEERLKIEPQV